MNYLTSPALLPLSYGCPTSISKPDPLALPLSHISYCPKKISIWLTFQPLQQNLSKAELVIFPSKPEPLPAFPIIASSTITLRTAQSSLFIFLFSWHLLPLWILPVPSQQGLPDPEFSVLTAHSWSRRTLCAGSPGGLPHALHQSSRAIASSLAQMCSKVSVGECTVTKSIQRVCDEAMNEWFPLWLLLEENGQLCPVFSRLTQ